MSHFAVLTALELPQNVPTSLQDIPEADVKSHIMQEICLTTLLAKPEDPKPAIPDVTDQWRLETLVDGMAEDLLEPYCECTDDPAYLEFIDETDSGREEYDKDTVNCVRMSDGRILPAHHYAFSRKYELYEGKVYKRVYGQLRHRKRTKKARRILPLIDYPLKQLYPTFDAYMRDFCGLDLNEQGRYGYYRNPNSHWDWYEIGGRWPFFFLVKEDCPYAVNGRISWVHGRSPKGEAPDGYRWVAGARKCDIAWDVMRGYYQKKATEEFHRYEEWFHSGQIPEELRPGISITENGIFSWDKQLYFKDETLEEYLNDTWYSDSEPYPVSTYACLDSRGGWRSVGEMGWLGFSSNEKETSLWRTEVREFIASQPEDAFLVSVDCHI